MLAKFSIANELSDIVRSYVEEHQIESSKLTHILSKQYPDPRMPITDWWEALNALREITQISHIGLELGKLVAPSHVGSLGYLVQTSDNVLDALQAFQTYERVLYEGAISTVEVQEKCVRVEWPLDNGNSTRESDDTLMSGLISFLRTGTGESNLAPASIGFVHAPPKDITPYREYFGSKLNFNCPCNFMTFTLPTANIPMRGTDPILHSILKEKVEHQLKEMPETEVFLRWFYQHLFMAIRMGEATVEFVAKRMMLSPRTLFRRLDEHNLHFKEVLLETRRSLAEKYLTEGKLTHSEIAIHLGYSEQSAFSRAFKTWTNLTPLQYQKSVQQDK